MTTRNGSTNGDKRTRPASARRNGHVSHSATTDILATTPRSGVPGTEGASEWDRLSPVTRAEVEQLVEVLKAVKQGDFGVRFAYHKDGVLEPRRASCSTTSSA